MPVAAVIGYAAAADVAPIAGQLDNGLRGCFHERGVAVALVGAQHLAQFRRHGNRDMEVGARQKLGLACRDPALSLILMASRAAPVLARVVGVDLAAAAITAP